MEDIGSSSNQVDNNDNFTPEVLVYQDYYPFGFGLVGRKYTANGEYRYGFNGKENDLENEERQDYGARIYDGRIAKFLSIDPLFKEYPWWTPYQFAGNHPTSAVDIDGEEPDKQFDPNSPWNDDVNGNTDNENDYIYDKHVDQAETDPNQWEENQWWMRHAPRPKRIEGGEPVLDNTLPDHLDEHDDLEQEDGHKTSIKKKSIKWGWAFYVGSGPYDKIHKKILTFLEWSIGNPEYNILGKERLSKVGTGSSYHSTGGWRHKRIDRLTKEKKRLEKKDKHLSSRKEKRLKKLKDNRMHYFGLFIWGDKHQVRLFNRNIAKKKP